MIYVYMFCRYLFKFYILKKMKFNHNDKVIYLYVIITI